MTTLTHARGRRYAVFGLARSGIATAKALLAGGATVACWDDGEASRAAAAKVGLPLVDLTTADWSAFQSLVLAPGVPLTHPVPHWTVAKAKAGGVEIIGDIELFFRERAAVCPDATVVAITGTNGKSTTTALIAHILREAGRDVAMGGNIGVGVLALPPPAKDRIHVLELSSFQIDLTPTLNPTVGVLLNITPDHLDRHGTMETYAAIKTRVVERCDIAVVSVDDTRCKGLAVRLRTSGRTLLETSWADDGKDVWFEDSGAASLGPAAIGIVPPILKQRSPDGKVMELAVLDGINTLQGAHNRQNTAAAIAVVTKLGVDSKLAADALHSYPGLPHRMEQIGRVGKVLLINDSKATNADSTAKALASFIGDIYWIVGGVQKEGGIDSLDRYFGRIKKAYLIGKSAAEFEASIANRIPVEHSDTLGRALNSALVDATASGATEPIILLSPACASYDQYKSFEHRGDHFRALATALPGFSRE